MGPAQELEPLFERFGLTAREREVLVLLLEGRSYKAMQEELFVSLQTIKNHVSRIYKEAEVKNRVELANLVRNTTRLDSR